MIIRFDVPWLHLTSPIKIRFVDAPPIPVDTSFGIECGIYWAKPGEVESRLVLVPAKWALT
jgi:hypothetical protein